MTMKKLLAILLVLLLAGCAAVVKVEGDQTLNNKLAVKLPDAWNARVLPEKWSELLDIHYTRSVRYHVAVTCQVMSWSQSGHSTRR